MQSRSCPARKSSSEKFLFSLLVSLKQQPRRQRPLLAVGKVLAVVKEVGGEALGVVVVVVAAVVAVPVVVVVT